MNFYLPLVVVTLLTGLSGGCAVHAGGGCTSNHPASGSPEIVLNGLRTISQGQPCTIHIAVAYPRDGPGLISLAIDWGDGTPAKPDSQNFPVRSCVASHIYAAGIGQAAIQATLTDANGTYESDPLELTITGIFPPAAPTDLAAQAYSPTEVRLTWKHPSHARSYQFEISSDAGRTWQAATTYSDENETWDPTGDFHQVYEYRVIAVNDAGSSPPSAPSNPVRPVEDRVVLRVIPQAGGAKVEWTYRGSDESGFELEMCEPGVDNYHLIAVPGHNFRAAVVSGLLPTHSYQFRICVDHETDLVSEYGSTEIVTIPGKQ